MAISPVSKYPTQVDNTDPAGYPYGKAKNEGTPGISRDGTPFEKEWVSDVWGLLQSLLAAASLSPTNTPDKVGASQYLDAIKWLTRNINGAVNIVGGLVTFATNAPVLFKSVNAPSWGVVFEASVRIIQNLKIDGDATLDTLFANAGQFGPGGLAGGVYADATGLLVAGATDLAGDVTLGGGFGTDVDATTANIRMNYAAGPDADATLDPGVHYIISALTADRAYVLPPAAPDRSAIEVTNNDTTSGFKATVGTLVGAVSTVDVIDGAGYRSVRFVKLGANWNIAFVGG